MDHDILTAERLRELLHYDPETGVFTWKFGRRGHSAGSRAGSKHSGGYIDITIDKKHYYAHRLAWLYTFGEWPAGDVDHINGRRDDNRIANLRDVSRSMNNQNLRTSHRDSISGLLGVGWDGRVKRWQAMINVDGKSVRLGYFADKHEAAAVYLDAKRRLHEGCSI